MTLIDQVLITTDVFAAKQQNVKSCFIFLLVQHWTPLSLLYLIKSKIQYDLFENVKE